MAMLLPQVYRDLVEAIDLSLVASFLTLSSRWRFLKSSRGGLTAGGGGMLGNASATGLS